MRSGPMRHLCSFQRRVVDADEYGNPVGDAWVEFWEDWGDLRLETGAERLRAGRLTDGVSGNLRLRRYAENEGLTTGDRVVIDAIAYAITGVISQPGSGQIEVTLMADPDA